MKLKNNKKESPIVEELNQISNDALPILLPKLNSLQGNSSHLLPSYPKLSNIKNQNQSNNIKTHNQKINQITSLKLPNSESTINSAILNQSNSSFDTNNKNLKINQHQLISNNRVLPFDVTLNKVQNKNISSIIPSKNVVTSSQINLVQSNSIFSGNSHVEQVRSFICNNKDNIPIDTCRTSIISDGFFSGTLTEYSTNNFYPTQDVLTPMGSCDFEIRAEDLTEGTSHSDFGHYDLVSTLSNEPGTPPQSRIVGGATLHPEQKKLSFGISIDGHTIYCPVEIGTHHLVPYVENNGVITSSDVNSFSGPLNDPDSLESYISGNNEWSVTLYPKNSQPTIKVKGKIFIEPPKGDFRGNIFLRNLKVNLCSSTTVCPETAYTDTHGNFELSSKTISKEQAKLKITFMNKEKDLLAAQFPKSEPATILFSNLPFVLDEDGNYIANTDIKFLPSSPFLTINNMEGSKSLSNIDAISLADLAAFFYYGEKALDYSKQNLQIIPLTFEMPLKINVDGPTTHYDSGGFVNGITNIIRLDKTFTKYILDVSDVKTEVAQDSFFHEFGHFLTYQYNHGKHNVDAGLSKDFIYAFVSKYKQPPLYYCHYGYGHRDSSCSLNEAKGTFFSLLLADKVNDDIGHELYKRSSHIFRYDIGDLFFANIDWEISKFKIAGTASSSTSIPYITGKWPFFIDNYVAEEFALTSLLWDLYDSENPSEYLDVDSLTGELVREEVTIPFNDFISIVLPAKTTSDLYIKLKQSGYSNAAIDAIFAANGICKDFNHNGKCSKSEVVDGISAWSVLIPGGGIYSYPYGGYEYPLGRP